MPSAAFSTRPNVHLVFDVWVASQDVGSNTSVIRRRLRAVEQAQQPSFTGNAEGWAVSVDGQNAGGSWTFDFRPGGMQSYTLLDDQITVGHNGDGTKSVGASATINGGPLGSASISFAVDVPTIARATSPNQPATTAAGSNMFIGLPRADSSFTHNIWAQFGSYGAWIAGGVGVSYTWAVPMELLTRIPSSTSGTGTITVDTFNGGGTWIGSRSVGFTVTAGPSVVPTISSISGGDDNPTVASLIGAYVQGQSLLRAHVAASGVYGSSITQAQFSTDGNTAGSGGVIPLNTAGVRAVGAAVTDSRGRTATSSGSVTVLPYSEPAADFTAGRADAAGDPDVNGEHLRIVLTAGASSLVVGTEKNNLTVRVHTRPRGGSAWTARNVITPSGITYAGPVLISGGGIFAADQAWEIKVEASDRLLTSVDYFTVGTVGAILDHLGSRVAINKMVEASGPLVQLGGETRIYDGSLRVDGIGMIDGFDLRLGAGNQIDRGDSGLSRAMVKIAGSPTGSALLVVNYAGDFTGGIKLSGPRVLVDGDLQTAGLITSPHLERLGLKNSEWGRAQNVDQGDFNDLVDSGWFRGSQMANRPPGGSFWWHIMVEAHDENWIKQTATLFGTTDVWIRVKNGGTWASWVKVGVDAYSKSESDGRYVADISPANAMGLGWDGARPVVMIDATLIAVASASEVESNWRGNMSTDIYNREITWTRRATWTGDNGQIGYAPSTRESKQGITAASLARAALTAIPIVQYQYNAEVAKADADPEYRAAVEIGSLAEDLHDLGLWQFVVYEGRGEDAVPVSIHYELLGLAALALAQILATEIDTLTESLTALAERVAALEGTT